MSNSPISYYIQGILVSTENDHVTSTWKVTRLRDLGKKSEKSHLPKSCATTKLSSALDRSRRGDHFLSLDRLRISSGSCATQFWKVRIGGGPQNYPIFTFWKIGWRMKYWRDKNYSNDTYPQIAYGESNAPLGFVWMFVVRELQSLFNFHENFKKFFENEKVKFWFFLTHHKILREKYYFSYLDYFLPSPVVRASPNFERWKMSIFTHFLENYNFGLSFRGIRVIVFWQLHSIPRTRFTIDNFY